MQQTRMCITGLKSILKVLSKLRISLSSGAVSFIKIPRGGGWWGPGGVGEAYRQYQAGFTSIACPIVATTAELTELLQLEFGVAEKVLLYFDISRDSGGDFRNIIRQNERMWSLYQERLSLLDKFDLLPKYKIITPRH